MTHKSSSRAGSRRNQSVSPSSSRLSRKSSNSDDFVIIDPGQASQEDLGASSNSAEGSLSNHSRYSLNKRSLSWNRPIIKRQHSDAMQSDAEYFIINNYDYQAVDALLLRQKDYGSEIRKAVARVGKNVSDLGARFKKILLKSALVDAENAYDLAVSYTKPRSTNNDEYGSELTLLAKKAPKDKSGRSLLQGYGSAHYFEYEQQRHVLSPNRPHHSGLRHIPQHKKSSYGLRGD